MTLEYIISLYDYYKYIDFNTLSKVKIEIESKNNDGSIIFNLSNIMHITNKETGNNLTKEQKKYIDKIINLYKNSNENNSNKSN